MGAEHDKPLIDRLRESLAPHGAISKFATETGIPRERVAKWVQRGSKISHVDALVATEWLDKENGTIVPDDTPADQATISKALLGSLQDLSYASRKNSDTMEAQTKNIAALIENDRGKTRSIEMLVNIIAVKFGVLPHEALVPYGEPGDLSSGYNSTADPTQHLGHNQDAAHGDLRKERPKVKAAAKKAGA